MTKTTSSPDLSAATDGAVALLVGDRVTVDLDDDDVGGKVDLVREGAGTDAGDGDAALDAEVLSDGRGDGLLGDAELVLTDVTGVRTGGRLGTVAEVRRRAWRGPRCRHRA